MSAPRRMHAVLTIDATAIDSFHSLRTCMADRRGEQGDRGEGVRDQAERGEAGEAIGEHQEDVGDEH
jgi:hypothetical protein